MQANASFHVGTTSEAKHVNDLEIPRFVIENDEQNTKD